MANEKISTVGGARIGWLNATWPLANLNVNKNSLELYVLFKGNYKFLPEQVISIERYGIIPLIGWGIRIHHNIASYPDKIIFWCFGDPVYLILKIRDVGFIPAGNQTELPIKRTAPVRWYGIIALIVLWNLLFILDVGMPPKPTVRPGWFSFLAVLLFFLGSIGIRRFLWLQKLFLKPNRSLNEIIAWLNLITVILGFLSMILLSFLLTASF
jgi:hypothetical protein